MELSEEWAHGVQPDQPQGSAVYHCIRTQKIKAPFYHLMGQEVLRTYNTYFCCVESPQFRQWCFAGRWPALVGPMWTAAHEHTHVAQDSQASCPLA